MVKEFVKKDDLAKLFLPYALNEKEKDLLKRIEDKKVKEIVVKAKHGEIEKIEIKKDEVPRTSRSSNFLTLDLRTTIDY